MSYPRESFVHSFNALQKDVHETAKQKGWWEFEDKVSKLKQYLPEDLFNEIVPKIILLNTSALISLVHSELSEGTEGLRTGNLADDKIPEFSSIEAEFADVIIRIMDLSQARGWRIAEAVIAKSQMNKTRQKMHGGKKF